MPSSTPGLPPGPSVTRFTTLDRAQRVRFRRAVALMVMTVLVPGSAQLVAGNRRVGRIAMRVWMGLLVLAVVSMGVSWFFHGFAFWAVSNTALLGLLRLLLMVLAVVGVNGLLCFSVAGTLLFGAHMVGVQRQFMITMFGDGEVAGASDGRFNVLLLGGDSGAGRWGLRPDSLTVASIDARTGKTVLVGLPRNMANFPFAEGSVMAEKFPKGFNCPDCYLNGVSTWAQDHPELFKGSRTPGIDATEMAVEGITGLEINYWSMVNLAGFRSLVDAVGGVTLTVRDPIPVGLPHDDFYRFIEPGTRKLNGMDTLWFARARDGSDDYSRMARQKCVMNAMLQQISPQDALSNFSEIAAASSEMISTNVPKSEVDTFLDLAVKAKSQKIGTVSLVPPKVVTADPDIDVVHSMVAAAIDRAEGDEPTRAPASEAPAEPADDGSQAPVPTPSTVDPVPPPSVTGGSIGSLKEGYAANQADDLGSAC